MFVLGGLWGRHLLVLTNLSLGLWVGGRGCGGGLGWDEVEEWQSDMNCNNGDMSGRMLVFIRDKK